MFFYMKIFKTPPRRFVSFFRKKIKHACNAEGTALTACNCSQAFVYPPPPLRLLLLLPPYQVPMLGAIECVPGLSQAGILHVIRTVAHTAIQQEVRLLLPIKAAEPVVTKAPILKIPLRHGQEIIKGSTV